MGIDNTSILFFGWIIDFGAIRRLFNSTEREFCQESCQCRQCTEICFEIMEELEDWRFKLGDHEFQIRMASPYYDCGIYDDVYIFGLVYDSINLETMAQLLAIRNHPNYSQLMEKVRELGASDIDPEIISLPHIY